MSKIEPRGTVVESNPGLSNENNRNIKRNKRPPRVERQGISSVGDHLIFNFGDSGERKNLQ
jgi:hypothetical protein